MAGDPGNAMNRGDPRTVVRSGWNQASEKYRGDRAACDAFGHTDQEYREWLRPLFEELAQGSLVLDLGCGCGVPADRMLVERFRVTGVDISDVQIERARRLVPAAEFLRADMTELEFPDGRFGGVLALYSLIHVPLDDQPPMLRRIHRWLRPGGLGLVITGHAAFTGYDANWLGSPGAMFWSHADADTYQRWLEESGFHVRERQFVPEGETGHELFLVVRAERRAP